MSEVHVQEPPTCGKVLLKTNKGDITMELWSKECPKACRNFVQLCVEGYYHGCQFFRIIPNFMAQTGDPTNTGSESYSIFGEPYPDEFHTRLRYRYRGLVGVASQGKGTHSNGSQFFITLAKQEALYGQHTLFGKLVGDSVYVFSDIGEVEVDKNDRPIGDFPPVILETVVLENPFPDIVPRDRKPPFEQGKKSEHRPVLEAKPKISAKKTKVLSFADEEEEEIGESVPVTIRSAHDLGGSLSSTAFEPKSAKKDEKISTQNDTKTSDLESLMRPNVPASIPKAESAPPSNAIQSEIVRLQAMIKAAESRPQPVATVKPVEKKKHAEEAEDQQIVKKLREWGSLVHKSKTEELTGKEAVSPKAAKKETLFALISSAEGGSVGGSDWLKSAGTLKFSIDSKNAFSR